MTISALEDATDGQTDEPSENIAVDFIEYFRGNVIANEEQGLLGFFQLGTGYLYPMANFTNLCYIGPPGGGKSLGQDALVDVVPSRDAYTTDKATSSALVDDDSWDRALVAPLNEYDKLGGEIREYLKSMAGEDGGFSKQRTVEDPDSITGYQSVEISSDAMPFQLLYAPRGNKGGIDKELDDRMLTVHVDDSKEIREAIGRKEAGHELIDVPGLTPTYIYDTVDEERAIRNHLRQLPTEKTTVEREGDDPLVKRRGGTFTEMPRWVWYACDPIFDKSYTYTNRVYGMVFNLMRSSASLNQHARKRVEKTVERDGERETVDAVLVYPQDVANVLLCQRSLLSTTHQLDPRKRNILDAVSACQQMSSSGRATVTQVKDWLENNDRPCPESRTTLKNLMDELVENYFLRCYDAAGGPNGRADLYEWRDEGSIQPPRLTDLQSYADRDGVTLGEWADVGGWDVDDPFADCWDPIRDQPFAETVREFDVEFSSEEESETTSAASFMSGDTDNSDSSDGGGDDASGQASLTDVTDDGVDTPSSGDDSGAGTLSSDANPQGQTEQYVLEQVRETADNQTVFSERHGVLHKMGVAETDEEVSDLSLTDTPADPDHELWADRPDLADERVRSVEDGRRELDDAYARLRERGLIAHVTDDVPAGFHTLQTV
jgi:hypothetical protein